MSPASALLPVVPALNGFSAVQSMKEWQPDIFTFLDYREYLQAYYEAAKENTRAFSYRYFARKAGLSSASFLRHVMRGERNIRGSTQQFSKALSHTKEESEFFEMLVKFSQATSDSEKNKVFERVCAFRRFREARRIDKAMFHYLSHWYYPAIREMTARSDFREDPTWIGSQLIPPVPAKKVAGALDVLLELLADLRQAFFVVIDVGIYLAGRVAFEAKAGKMVCAVARLGFLAVDHRVIEAADMAGRLPDLRVHDDGGFMRFRS